MTHPEMLRKNMISQIANGRLQGYQTTIFKMTEDQFMALCEQLIDDHKIHEKHLFGREAWKDLMNALNEHRQILIRLGALEEPQPRHRRMLKY